MNDAAIKKCRKKYDSICTEKISNEKKIEKLEKWIKDGNEEYGYAHFGFFAYLAYRTIYELKG